MEDIHEVLGNGARTPYFGLTSAQHLAISVSHALTNVNTSVNLLYDLSPQPSHGASPGLETTQGQARTGQEQIDELDEGGR